MNIEDYGLCIQFTLGRKNKGMTIVTYNKQICADYYDVFENPTGQIWLDLILEGKYVAEAIYERKDSTMVSGEITEIGDVIFEPSLAFGETFVKWNECLVTNFLRFLNKNSKSDMLKTKIKNFANGELCL